MFQYDLGMVPIHCDLGHDVLCANDMYVPIMMQISLIAVIH